MTCAFRSQWRLARPGILCVLKRQWAALVGQMEQPPKIIDVPAVVEPPILSGSVSTATPASGAPASAPRNAPVHPLAALVLIGVDNLWNLADWAVIDWVVTIPLSFVTVFVPTLIIQRTLRRDPWGRALLLSLILGALAAVPTSITGTPAGLAFLAWSGLHRLFGSEFPKRPSLGS